jgi:hypothetical protein
MQFNKYLSIPHFDEEKEINYLKELIVKGEVEDRFVVQEKVH